MPPKPRMLPGARERVNASGKDDRLVVWARAVACPYAR